jgi:hypothetical protein
VSCPTQYNELILLCVLVAPFLKVCTRSANFQSFTHGSRRWAPYKWTGSFSVEVSTWASQPLRGHFDIHTSHTPAPSAVTLSFAKNRNGLPPAARFRLRCVFARLG